MQSDTHRRGREAVRNIQEETLILRVEGPHEPEREEQEMEVEGASTKGPSSLSDKKLSISIYIKSVPFMYTSVLIQTCVTHLTKTGHTFTVGTVIES